MITLIAAVSTALIAAVAAATIVWHAHVDLAARWRQRASTTVSSPLALTAARGQIVQLAAERDRYRALALNQRRRRRIVLIERREPATLALAETRQALAEARQRTAETEALLVAYAATTRDANRRIVADLRAQLDDRADRLRAVTVERDVLRSARSDTIRDDTARIARRALLVAEMDQQLAADRPALAPIARAVGEFDDTHQLAAIAPRTARLRIVS